MGSKNGGGFVGVLKFLKDYRVLITVLAGIVGTVATIPGRLQAVEKKAETLQEQTTAIYRWIEQAEKEAELIKKAPPGYRWSEEAGEYVSWSDDPRLRKRR